MWFDRGVKNLLIALIVVAAGPPVDLAFGQYRLPPKDIVDILDAAPLPTAAVSPSGQVLALLERASMPPIAELAQPMLRLAGLRIDPRTSAPHRAQTLKGLSLRSIADGAAIPVTLPPNPRLSWIGFSPDGARFAFTQTRDTGVELWMGDALTGEARAISTAGLNAVWGDPCEWLDDSSAMLCRFVPPSRGAAPVAPEVPDGPNIQENQGRAAPVRTYQDLLTSAHDEALFEHYGTSLLAIVDAATGARRPVGPAGLYEIAKMSPNGEYLVVTRLKPPFSRLVPAGDFAKDVQVWNRRGDIVITSGTGGLYPPLVPLARVARIEGDNAIALPLADPGDTTADLEIQVTALEYTELRVLSSMAHGGQPGPEVSGLKVRGSEIQQRVCKLGDGDALEVAVFTFELNARLAGQTLSQ